VEFKVYIYIFLALAYYAYKYYKKLKENPQNEQVPLPQTPQKNQKKSFEPLSYEPETSISFEKEEQKIVYEPIETSFTFENTESNYINSNSPNKIVKFAEYEVNKPKTHTINFKNPRTLKQTLLATEILKKKF
jgi:hypothetical protein